MQLDKEAILTKEIDQFLRRGLGLCEVVFAQVRIEHDASGAFAIHADPGLLADRETVHHVRGHRRQERAHARRTARELVRAPAAVARVVVEVEPVGARDAERRRELDKVCKKMAEDGRVAIRHVRRDAMEQLKKHGHDSGVTEDEVKHAEKELQKLTDEYNAKIDQHLTHKEKEIMTV